ncbi:MAG: alpha/beta hydrolase [Bacteroidota bacterium]
MIYYYKEVPIFYEIYGNGPAIVLLHGFLESSSMWKQFITEFSRSKTVITIDLPGHGKSASISPIHSMEQMAEVVSHLLDFLRIEKTSILGHSMGGYVSLALLEKYPEKINTFVLLNSTTRADSAEVKLRRNRATALLEKNKATVINTTIPNLFASGSRHLYTEQIETLKQEALTFSSAGIIAANLGMRDRIDRTEVLKVHKKEKIVIWAEDDPIVSRADSEEMIRITHSKSIRLPGGHMSWVEHPTEIVKIMLFIE